MLRNSLHNTCSPEPAQWFAIYDLLCLASEHTILGWTLLWAFDPQELLTLLSELYTPMSLLHKAVSCPPYKMHTRCCSFTPHGCDG